MLGADSISLVLDVLRPERAELVALLSGLSDAQWSLPTECPEYSVKGIASHLLGDDLSLLSRQRDAAENGLIQVARRMPGSDFRALLDAFNDQWVGAAAFFSPQVLIELLRRSGEWTAIYYCDVDPEAPGEPVGFFGPHGAASPFWHAIAREYVERWAHHSQIRRAIGRASLAERRFLAPGLEVIAAAVRVEPTIPEAIDGDWMIGPVVLGRAEQAATILTRGHPTAEVRELISGPPDLAELLATILGRS